MHTSRVYTGVIVGLVERSRCVQWAYTRHIHCYCEEIVRIRQIRLILVQFYYWIVVMISLVQSIMPYLLRRHATLFSTMHVQSVLYRCRFNHTCHCQAMHTHSLNLIPGISRGQTCFHSVAYSEWTIFWQKRCSAHSFSSLVVINVLAIAKGITLTLRRFRKTSLITKCVYAVNYAKFRIPSLFLKKVP